VLTSTGLDERAIHQITRNSCRHGGGNLRTDCTDQLADTNPTLGMRIELSPMAFLWRSVLQRRRPFKLGSCQELGKAREDWAVSDGIPVEVYGDSVKLIPKKKKTTNFNLINGQVILAPIKLNNGFCLVLD